ncbi:MAG: hypothetical protein D6727_00290 [Gammaproteobacteria bacterium]|nr:MAG: hypothetical protein D6727_00290 [Gammaproteobacteria bacterium]
MSEKDPIRIFVAHLFDEDADYSRLFEYLESRDNFFYVNTSRPDDMPAGGGEAIRDTLRKQINAAEIVIVPVATHNRNPELVDFQMDLAESLNKPLLGIRSFGGTVMLSKELLQRCADVVEWNDRVITDAIRKLARNEDTSQWEVIDFDPDLL